MTNLSSFSQDYPKAGDAAVNGLFGGLVAGVGMAIALVTTGLVTGSSGASTLARFDPSNSSQALTGTLAHLAVSGTYGLIFGLIWSTATRLMRMHPSLRQTILAGGGYGLMLWLAAHFVLLPGTQSPLRELAIWQFLSAHLVYGLLLGWRVGRSGQQDLSI